MGQFSWITQDTKKQIYNDYDKQTIHMVDPRDGTDYIEKNYEGYGIFGGRDFYELFADLNVDIYKKLYMETALNRSNIDLELLKACIFGDFVNEYIKYNDEHKKSLHNAKLFYINLCNDGKQLSIEKFDEILTQSARDYIEDTIKPTENELKVLLKPFGELTEDDIDIKRSIGIDLWTHYVELDGITSKYADPIPNGYIIKSPILIENYEKWKLYVNRNPKTDSKQGWHYEEEEENED